MTNIYHVIKDPVHGTMQFTTAEDHWVKPFIDSPNFQRLRHIKQLGLGDLIFPGAMHSRFNHSLGCCYVAGQIAQKVGLTDAERQLVMIAGLLHDIGHGPFSHAFEDIFVNKLIRHEDWTPYFLADFAASDFFSRYNQLNPRHRLTQEKFNDIADMIMHKKDKKTVLADIVSSQLDADRLDYLLRDSHFCGVRYGEFDFRWMLHCMAIVPSIDGERLGITHKGIGAVEHYLMARRLMTRNIYHSQKKLALEWFLVEMLAHLAQRLHDYAPYARIRESRLGHFLLAVHQFNVTVAAANDEKRHKRDFISQQFNHYKELCDYDVFALIKELAYLDDGEPATQMARRLQERVMPKIIRLDDLDLGLVKQALQDFKAKHADFSDWQLLFIQTPHRSYSGEEDPILVVNEQGHITPIGDFSLMINAISDKLEHVAFLCIDQVIAADKRIINFVNELRSSPWQFKS